MDLRPYSFDSLLDAMRWQERLDEAHALDRSGRLAIFTSTSSSVAAATILLAQAAHVSDSAFLSYLSQNPIYVFSGGVLLLLGALYIGYTLSRRSRDVSRNELRLLRRELQLLNIRRGEAETDASTQDP